MKYFDLSFQDACRWIETNFYFSQKSKSNSKYIIKPVRSIKKNNSTLKLDRNYKANPEVLKWFFNQLPLSNKAKSYLNSRGYTTKTIEYFKIRDTNNPTSILKKAERHFGIDTLINTGLAKINEEKKIKYAWWDHVIIFPFYNESNDIIYLQGRRFSVNGGKYINLLNLKGELFNRQILKTMDLGELLYICEGITDCISAHQFKLKAVGVLGANSFKKEWVEFLSNYRIRVVPDSDDAGQKFARKVEESFLEIGKNIQILKLPEGQDFSDFLYKNTK